MVSRTDLCLRMKPSFIYVEKLIAIICDFGAQKIHIAHERDSQKVNVFCAITNRCAFGPFFFVEKSTIGYIFQDMLSEWLFPQLEEAVPGFILQFDGAPPHWRNNIRVYLNDRQCRGK
ncbi:hypothetical protein AVEN_124770-1 [Araneus ventricosus]|uniref:Tc1-like transposase DDE domain-containing protein n=1 Tax=Araneus ventricosus TaxID=182803 RepID=A0A4Y2KJA9_ARAVE|nr:hypothetical protein AVEN_124770-1 [Araneus ventricosus]